MTGIAISRMVGNLPHLQHLVHRSGRIGPFHCDFGIKVPCAYPYVPLRAHISCIWYSTIWSFNLQQ